MSTIVQRLADELNIQPWQVQRTVELLDEGNTIPFIARYRQERTGELDEEVLRQLSERLEALRAIAKRREEVQRLLEEQGNLTPELAQAINEADSLQRIDDLYRPYRPKRRTRAMVAKERGLLPLAQAIVGQGPLADQIGKKTPAELAIGYVKPDQGVETVDDALSGAIDIVAEMIADDPDVRAFLREATFSRGFIQSKQVPPENEEGDEAAPDGYEMYHDFSESVARIRPHRVLALNRGEKEGALRVRIEVDSDGLIELLIRRLRRSDLIVWEQISRFPDLVELFQRAVSEAYRRLLAPAVERDIRSSLTEKAEIHAVEIFAQNLRRLLLQPPVTDCVVMGIDPGYRTGCKVAVTDPTGHVIATETIYPHPPQKRWREALATLNQLVVTHGVDVIAIGNGTASRESERLVAELVKGHSTLRYLVINEAGASVYSASPLARRELPDLDVAMRGAVSIARRLQDPLAELVKIEPRSIGVGQYQHDVDARRLERSLAGVVESCVNYVGVEVNTASPALLEHVAGLSKRVAEAIVQRRVEKGPYQSRKELLDVKGIGAKTFEQCAGFLRIRGAQDPLDNTAVHPESYDAARRLLKMVGVEVNGVNGRQVELQAEFSRQELDFPQVADELGIGEPTLRDIVEELTKPGRDPRDELPPPLFRSDVMELTDLKPGMQLTGSVVNVVDFGAFVDIGLEKAGLVHISQLSDTYVSHPLDVVSVGDIVNVWVLEVDERKGRIALSMKENPPPQK